MNLCRFPGCWCIARLATMVMCSQLTGPLESFAADGEDRSVEVKRILAQAPKSEHDVAKEMNVVLLADVKDHGPAGNGKHDYPLWQKRWALLLGGRDASSERQVNLSGPPSQNSDCDQGSPGVRVTTARQWPSDTQFQTADVIVAFCYLSWNDERLAQVRQYLEHGGGLVLVHSATWTRPGPSQSVAEVVGVGGFQLFRHGPVRLDVSALSHPICRGLPKVVTFANDETYWPPTPMMDSATVLATVVEGQGVRGSTPEASQPMFWCYEVGKGRVFGSVPGHCCETFDDPLFRIFLLRGISWAAGESPYRLDELILKGL